jgi:flagellar basal body-associated protein FliL
VKNRARRLRIIGVIVLVLGIAGAGIVYWLGTRSPDLSGDLSMAGYDKPAERQMEILYGKQGEMIEDFANDLKQPGTQAVIVVTAVALVAGLCFYFAHLSDDDDAPR